MKCASPNNSSRDAGRGRERATGMDGETQHAVMTQPPDFNTVINRKTALKSE